MFAIGNSDRLLRRNIVREHLQVAILEELGRSRFFDRAAFMRVKPSSVPVPPGGTL